MKKEMMGWQWHQMDHMKIICTLLQTDNHTSTSSLAICHPSVCTVVSGIIIVVVVGVCNCSQMRTSKCACLIFGGSTGLDPG